MYINNKSNNNKNKSYSIVDFPEDSKLYGNFIANSPKSAASQAFSHLLKFLDIDQNNEDSFLGKFLVFTIVDKNNNKRIKLKNPISVSKNNGTVTYKYKDIIGKYKEELDQI